MLAFGCHDLAKAVHATRSECAFMSTDTGAEISAASVPVYPPASVEDTADVKG